MSSRPAFPRGREIESHKKGTTMAGKRQSGDVDQTVTDGTVMVPPSPFQRMIRAMDMEATADEESNFVVLDTVNAILDAESDEEIWEADERGALNFQHLAGCDILITDVHVKYGAGTSDIQTPYVWEDKKMYLLVTVVRTSAATERPEIRLPEPGEAFTINTSATYVVPKIWAFYTKGKINPDTGAKLACYVKSVPLDGGKAVIKLRPPRAASAA
jgi:hypothetical protein